MLNRLSSRKFQALALVWIAAIVTSLPFLFKWPAPPHASGAAWHTLAGYVLTLAVVCFIFRRESRRLTTRHALALVILILILTKVTNRIHEFTVDYGPNAFAGVPNTAWQKMLQDNIIQRVKFDAPHAARFLPNAFVRWLELAGWGFPQARDLYRLLFNALLFYAIYCYARRFTSHVGALLALILTAVIYPVSFEYYAGQLTDPMSHLSFVLAFWFIETEDFAWLLTTILIGAVAKESVLAMAGYYVLFARRDKQYPLKTSILTLCCAAVYFGVRVFVIGGFMGYKDISGVTIEHVLRNLSDMRWPYVYLLTAGALAPLLLIGWKEIPPALRRLAIYLLAVLFVSSAFFSWLVETRNFMPAVIVMAVASGGWFVRATQRESPTAPA